ncbi:YetF domain-containing protein [Ammoniphilus sp. 3BR4]|uniref:YetF domain-containing protein n=1 Tax=Ammoniphilus sp. 3BR4 TaxID=3158265 RepID=UPI003466D634
METVWQTSLRTLIGFFILLLLTRVLGKKQLSQMTIFTYITGIALGNIAGDMVVHRDIKLIDGVTGLTLWALLTLGIEQLSLKSSKARVLLDGEPTIVIKNGKILEKAMASNKLNMDDLSMLLRDKNVFSVREVEYAILEPNGKISVLKKQEEENVTKKDLQIPLNQRLYIPTELVVDGKIVTRNLKELSLSQDWLENQLKLSGVQSVEEVFFAELQSDGSVYVDRKTDQPLNLFN